MSKRLFKSTGVVASMTMVSRVLGFVRDILLAVFFGASPAFDAFIIAFKIPNFFRRLFAEGAFSQAFVPLLMEHKSNKPGYIVHQFVGKVAGTLLISLLGVVLVAEVFTPGVVLIFAPGFALHTVRYDLATHMLYITFPYLLLISMAAFAGALLNSEQKFALPALMPVMLNIALISSAVIGVQYFNQPIFILAWGVLVGGVLQCVLPFIALYKKGMLPRFQFGFADQEVRRVLKKMVPALFGVSVAQIGLLIDSFFASFLPSGSISWLYYSDRLTFLPLGVIGVALATVVLPNLSKNYAEKDNEAYSRTLDWAIRTLLVVGVPAALGLFLMSGPILATLMFHGEFSAHDVVMTKDSLMAFSFGLPSFMLVKILASALYSRQNIKKPVKIAAIALLCNIVLDILLIGPWQHTGLAFATAAASYVNSFLLIRTLVGKGYYAVQPGWVILGLRIIAANAMLALVVIIMRGSLSKWLLWTSAARSFHLVSIILAAVIVYIATLYLSGMRFNDFKSIGNTCGDL